MKAIAERWNRFWFAAAEPADVAVARILFCAAMLWVGRRWNFEAWADLPDELFSPLPIPAALHFPRFSAATIREVAALWRGALFLTMVGFFTRGAALVAFLLGLYLTSLPQQYVQESSAMTALGLVPLVLALSRSGDALSVDALRRPRPAPSGRYRWPVVLVRVLFVLTFFAAGVTKLRETGPSWGTNALPRVFHVTRTLWSDHAFAPALRDRLRAMDAIERHGLAPALGDGALALELLSPLALVPGVVGLSVLAALVTMVWSFHAILFVDVRLLFALLPFFAPWSAIVERCRNVSGFSRASSPSSS